MLAVSGLLDALVLCFFLFFSVSFRCPRLFVSCICSFVSSIFIELFLFLPISIVIMFVFVLFVSFLSPVFIGFYPPKTPRDRAFFVCPVFSEARMPCEVPGAGFDDFLGGLKALEVVASFRAIVFVRYFGRYPLRLFLTILTIRLPCTF